MNVKLSSGENVRQNLHVFLCGMGMGTADIVPGVSGGTIAWITGVYPRLIAAIKSVDAGLLKPLLKADWQAVAEQTDLKFLMILAAGMGAAIILMIKVINLPFIMQHYPNYIYAVFFGLILGSIPMLLKQVEKPKFSIFYVALGIVSGLIITSIVPPATPNHALMMFLSGAVAILAMLLPGISGSFILLILGKYLIVMEAISQMDLSVLMPFAAGCVSSLLLFSRLLHWLLRRAYAQMAWFMAGLLLGSLKAVWPFQERVYQDINGKAVLMQSYPIIPAQPDQSMVYTIGLMVLGAIVTVVLLRGLDKPPIKTPA